DYLREQLKLPPNAPVNLWSVPDRTDGIKPARMVTLMMLAIYGSDAKKLTLQGIIQALIARFWYYNEHQADMSWKNSIRHSLSLYKMFVKVKRPVYDQGKGSYWVLDVSSGETFTRSRKR
ncbi:fork head domain-containing protein, partial [Mycena latifolia]